MITLNPEQMAIVKSTEKHVVVNAMPATGKTSLLMSVVEHNPDKNVLILSYNSALRADSKRWGFSNLDCHTGHSLARRGGRLERKYGNRLNKKLSWKSVRRVLRTTKEESKLVLKSLCRFLASSDERINESHLKLPSIPKTDEPGFKDLVESNLLGLTRLLWSIMKKEKSEVPIGHDGYLKIYCLSKPDLSRYQLILLDEIQDLNSAISHLITSQECRVIGVGDCNQELYSFRLNGESFFDHMRPTHHLTQSYRFGESVASIANIILNQMGWRESSVIGNNNIETVIGDVGDSYTIISDTNFGLIPEALALARTTGKKLFFTQKNPLYIMINMAHMKLGRKLSNSPMHKRYGTFERLLKNVFSGHALHKYSSFLYPLTKRECKAVLTKLEAIEDSLVDEEESDIKFSTCHQQKGQSIDNVKLSGFSGYERILEKTASKVTKGDREKLMTLFVAVTRCRFRLSLPNHLIPLLMKNIDPN